MKQAIKKNQSKTFNRCKQLIFINTVARQLSLPTVELLTVEPTTLEPYSRVRVKAWDSSVGAHLSQAQLSVYP